MNCRKSQLTTSQSPNKNRDLQSPRVAGVGRVCWDGFQGRTDRVVVRGRGGKGEGWGPL